MNNKMKKYGYIAIAILLMGWFVYRFVSVAAESKRYIYNSQRVEIETGIPIDVVILENKTDVLKTPLYVLDNTGLVSGSRIDLFESGEKIGDGKIVQVNKTIDLDTGMHIVKTVGVKDGLNYAQKELTGFFVPVNSVFDDHIFVVENGLASKKQVFVISKDANFAVITGDIQDGDILILSKVSENEKVNVKK